MNKVLDNQWLPSISRYGVALAGISLCGHATAGVVSLGTHFDTVGFGGTYAQFVSLGIASGGQYNDLYNYNGLDYGKTIFPGSHLAGLAMVNQSETLTAARFTNNTGFGFLASEAGTQFFGFLTDSGQLGWFQVDFGGSGGDVVYLAGAYSDTAGESIHVGTVPLPSSAGLMGLGLLATGASGVRKLRDQKQFKLKEA